jgi:Cu(I)/Ag(I) efflux system membrane fusion protein
MKTVLVTLVTILLSTTAFAQDHSGHSHDTHLHSLVNDYLEIKDALVNDDFEQARQHLSAFALEIRNNSEMNNHSEHASKHENHHGKMLEAVASAESAESIEELRTAFSSISIELLTAIENQNYEQMPLYVQFCPMANDGEGAKWLSNEEKIANPFYGQMMHKCGETVEKVN